MRLLHSDTCGSSGGARALRSPGSRSGRNQARSSDCRRTLLNSGTVRHNSHRTPTGLPVRELFALLCALFHKRRIRHGAHPYFHFLNVGPFSSARGPDRIGQIQHNSERRSQNATVCRKISRSNRIKTKVAGSAETDGPMTTTRNKMTCSNTNNRYFVDCQYKYKVKNNRNINMIKNLKEKTYKGVHILYVYMYTHFLPVGSPTPKSIHTQSDYHNK